jgi:chromosome segregation ATPase
VNSGVAGAGVPCVVFKDNHGKRAIEELDPDAMPINIGRAAGQDLRIPNASISRGHVRLELKGDQFSVIDLASRNGTFLNGKRVQESLLSDGDVLHLGEIPLVICMDDSQATGISDAYLIHGPARKHPVYRSRVKAKPPAPAPIPEPVEEEYVSPSAAPKSATKVLDLSELESYVQKGANKKKKPEVRVKAEVPEVGEPSKVVVAPPTPPRKRRKPPKSPKVDGDQEPASKPPLHSINHFKAAEEDQAKVKKYLDQIAQLTRERDELASELGDMRRQLKQAEISLARVSSREGRFEVELEALGEKYQTLKEQNRRHTSQVTELREEQAGKDEQIFDLERELEEVRSEMEGSQSKFQENEEKIKDLKVAITQRDKKNDDLQRQLDLTEYDLRAAREDIETIQSGFNQENSDMHKLERRMAHMKEILEEKEAHIESQRLELQEKDQEIRLAKMGVGIEDLETEKRKVLEDFYKKNQEVEELKGNLKEVEFQLNESQEQSTALGQRVEFLENKPIDVTGHPDHKAVQRELGNAQEQCSSIQAKLDDAEKLIKTFPPSEREKLEKEIRFVSRKLEATKKELKRAQVEGQKPALKGSKKGKKSIEATSESVVRLRESFEQWVMNLTLLKSYVRKIDKLLTQKKIPGGAAEALEGLSDLATVLQTDGSILGKNLAKLEKDAT